MKKFIVEKHETYYGEYENVPQMAEAIQFSKAKLNNLVSEMRTGEWNKLKGTDYRIGIR